MGESGSNQTTKYIAEFVGTYLLVLTVGCNVIAGNPIWAATSIACVLCVSVYALGAVSGANFNPAVSVALGLSQKMDWNDVFVYCLVQVVAGIAAAATYAAMFGKVFSLGPAPGFTWWEAGTVEMLYTFMLCFVVLNVSACKRNEDNAFYGLAIGFVIIAGGYGAGSISGGAFNPAVAMGISITSKHGFPGWGLAYSGFEMLGAGLAAGMFRVVRPDEFKGDSNYSLGTRCISEFLGTFFLVLTVGLNILGKSAAPVWSIAAALMCMIYALGNCSGAHFNPAVTLSIVAAGRKKMPNSEAACYVGAQLLGGTVASLIYTSMFGGIAFPLQPGPGFTLAGAGFAEFLGTSVLCFVVLCVATTMNPLVDLYGLAIGSCVTSMGLALGAVSGGSLNPAVSIGISFAQFLHMVGSSAAPAAVATSFAQLSRKAAASVLGNCGVYVVCELLGGCLAAGLLRMTHPKEYSRVVQYAVVKDVLVPVYHPEVLVGMETTRLRVHAKIVYKHVRGATPRTPAGSAIAAAPPANIKSPDNLSHPELVDYVTAIQEEHLSSYETLSVQQALRIKSTEFVEYKGSQVAKFKETQLEDMHGTMLREHAVKLHALVGAENVHAPVPDAAVELSSWVGRVQKEHLEPSRP